MILAADKQPGMIWIHGGGWTGGSGEQDRTEMVNRGIVAMSVQDGSKSLFRFF